MPKCQSARLYIVLRRVLALRIDGARKKKVVAVGVVGVSDDGDQAPSPGHYWAVGSSTESQSSP